MHMHVPMQPTEYTCVYIICRNILHSTDIYMHRKILYSSGFNYKETPSFLRYIYKVKYYIPLMYMQRQVIHTLLFTDAWLVQRALFEKCKCINLFLLECCCDISLKEWNDSRFNGHDSMHWLVSILQSV